MSVQELNREQLEELKQAYYSFELDQHGQSPSWEELIDIDDYVTDEEVTDAFDGTDFVTDDFCCSMGGYYE